jgi:uncharacterized protein YeaO (DUF488 family)
MGNGGYWRGRPNPPPLNSFNRVAIRTGDGRTVYLDGASEARIRAWRKKNAPSGESSSISKAKPTKRPADRVIRALGEERTSISKAQPTKQQIVVTIAYQTTADTIKALDISLKDAILTEEKIFAPTQEMIKQARNGQLTPEHYREKYLKLLRSRYVEQVQAFKNILEFGRVALICKCRQKEYCHCSTAKYVLQKLAEHYGYRFIDGGDRR